MKFILQNDCNLFRNICSLHILRKVHANYERNSCTYTFYLQIQLTDFDSIYYGASEINVVGQIFICIGAILSLVYKRFNSNLNNFSKKAHEKLLHCIKYRLIKIHTFYFNQCLTSSIINGKTETTALYLYFDLILQLQNILIYVIQFSPVEYLCQNIYTAISDL
jgi:hypothetical protein